MAVRPRGRGHAGVTALQVQVGLGERDDADAGRRDLGGHLALHVDRLHAEADAVAGGDAVGEA